jgi:hypothetical protein
MEMVLARRNDSQHWRSATRCPRSTSFASLQRPGGSFRPRLSGGGGHSQSCTGRNRHPETRVHWHSPGPAVGTEFAPQTTAGATGHSMGFGRRRRRFLKSCASIALCSCSSSYSRSCCRRGANTRDRKSAIVPMPDRSCSSETHL